MLQTLFISWDISPNLYQGIIELRYYSLLFGVSFFLGHFLMKKMMENEDCPEKWLDKILVYTVVATIIGARLGHVFFYDWDYYSKNLMEIPMVWKGGLASHGAAIAIIFAIWLYSKRVTKKSVFWALDKVVVTVAIAACFIRIGNLMNSEIIGHKSESSNAFFFHYEAKKYIASFFGVEVSDVIIEKTPDSISINGFTYPIADLTINYNPSDASSLNNYYQYFTSYNLKNYNSSEKHFFSLPADENFPKLNAEQNTVLSQIGVIPRVPTQLIEAICYFFIFLLLFWGYWRKKWFHYKGLIFGLFLALNFGARFFIEFYKENQTLTGESLLNMGQLLSIPAVIAGIFFIVRSLSNNSQLSNG